MKRQRGRGRVLTGSGLGRVLAGAAALCAVVALPGQALAAGEPAPYVFDTAAEPVSGSVSTADAPALTAGATYKDSIGPKGKRYYRLDLDAKSNAYVSAVAVPRNGPKVGIGDGLKVSVLDRGNTSCDSGDNVGFGSAEFARPISTYAARTIEEGASSCQEAGTYYVLVERTTADGSAPDDWPLEIRYQSEPGLKTAGPTEAPESWPSASPAPPVGGPQKRHGGTGFNDATGLDTGEWRDEIRPGQSLFYRVPLDWGQQIFSDIDLHSAVGTKNGFVGSAVSFDLYNPARGFVQAASSMSYDGKQKTAAMDPLPPVAYENRFTSSSGDGDMRLAGWYYLRVSLSPKVGTTFGDTAYGLTLRVSVKGDKGKGPAYAGTPGDFGVSDDDRDAAARGQSGAQAAKSGTMKLVAGAGIGTGTVLVLALGVWTLLARHRAAAAEGNPPHRNAQRPGAPQQNVSPQNVSPQNVAPQNAPQQNAPQQHPQYQHPQPAPGQAPQSTQYQAPQQTPQSAPQQQGPPQGYGPPPASW
ncbi:hypothetical protein ACIQM4_11615 [Streptomyces sp. NPDC091272]|uniref:hypothetical protein n=1 Tax=Streptomyces sp. NPDC091272 TaxID=3365981 RepID=UPI00381A9A0A